MPLRTQKATTVALPPPTEGWDTISPLAGMRPARAVTLTNWYPEAGYVRIRRGCTRLARVGTTPVETLFRWPGPGGDKLLAAAAGTIRDISTGSPGPPLVSGLSGNRWQAEVMTTPGGQFLVACNGLDPPMVYDGTAWSTSPAITGVTGGKGVSDLIQVAMHKRRLWFVQKGTTLAWYLGIDSIGGPASGFDFGPMFSKGGQLQAIGSWTRDNGVGTDDYLCAFSSTGQVAIYEGIDPSNSNSWSVTGVFDLGAPIGRRCVLRDGGDLIVISQDGFLPLGTVLPRDRAADMTVTLSANIAPQVTTVTGQYAANFGWQGILYPRGNMAVFNVPIAEDAVSEQYVMNAVTGAWCRWTGLNAACWSLFNDRLYFGGVDGSVYQADLGATDAGTAIIADLQTAWNTCATPVLKRATLVQPLLATDGTLRPVITVNADYTTTAPAGIPDWSGGGQSLWDVAAFDATIWSAPSQPARPWSMAATTGHALSVWLRATVSNQSGALWDAGAWDGGSWGFDQLPDVVLTCSGFTLVHEPGGPL